MEDSENEKEQVMKSYMSHDSSTKSNVRKMKDSYYPMSKNMTKKECNVTPGEWKVNKPIPKPSKIER